MKEVMCTTAEVQEIVSQAEKRLEKMISEAEDRQNKRLEVSHMSVSKSVSNFGNDLKNLKKDIEVFIELKINSTVEKSNDNNEQIKKNKERINNLSEAIAVTNTKITTAIWVFGITLPIIIALVSWIFLNELRGINAEIQETQETIKSTIPHEVSKVLNNYQFDVVE